MSNKQTDFYKSACSSNPGKGDAAFICRERVNSKRIL